MLFSCLFQCFEEKEYQTESKQNVSFGSDHFGTNAIQETWRPGVSKRKARPHPRGPLVAPLTDFLRLYILAYPENIQEHHKTLFPPPQHFVPARSHLGPTSSAPPEGESIVEGFYINAKACTMKCE